MTRGPRPADTLDAMQPHPLILTPILKEKVWGGRRLARLGKHLPADESVLIGESWELADLEGTSPSGGGGGAAHSEIANGPMAGRTIRDAIKAWGADLLGDLPLTERGGFPLLVKYLDAQESLSLQVHPSPEYAARHPGAHLKTECWFVLDAAPGSMIYRGVKPGVSAEAFREHSAGGRVVGDVIAHAARPGDFHNLPSGEAHALGAGVLVAEVQTPSDTTFRVYDWGRAGRDLHVDEAMQCIRFGVACAPPTRHDEQGLGPLGRTEFFAVDHLRLARGASLAIDMHGRPLVAMLLGGAARIGGAAAQLGDTMLVPAAAERADVHAETDSEALIITFPGRQAPRSGSLSGGAASLSP